MITIDLPDDSTTLTIENVIFDYNGTLATGGKLTPAVKEALEFLTQMVSVSVVTADTFGSVRAEFQETSIDVVIVRSAKEKLALLEKLAPKQTIAIGNGKNDALMLEKSVLGIGLLGKEGIAKEALMASDILMSDPLDVIDALEHPSKLIATLRD